MKIVNSLGRVVTENITIIPPAGMLLELTEDGTYRIISQSNMQFIPMEAAERRLWQAKKTMRDFPGTDSSSPS